MRVTPRWVSVALLIGAVICIAWGVFLLGFTSEPSADRRSRAVLVLWSSLSNAAALLGLFGAIGLIGRYRSGRPLAWVGSVLISASCIGAVAGIPALIGLWSSRNPSNP